MIANSGLSVPLPIAVKTPSSEKVSPDVLSPIPVRIEYKQPSLVLFVFDLGVRGKAYPPQMLHVDIILSSMMW